MRPAMLAAAAAALVACAGPVSAVRSGDARPALAFTSAPPGARLSVDGRDVGEAGWFDGKRAVLNVEPGTHDVVVSDAAGNLLLQQRVFVESETKTIEVH
jgi:hypothetical protein